MNIEYPRAKDVLTLLGVSGVVAASILIPGLPKVISPFLKSHYKKWGHFNRRRLRAEIYRLQSIGVVERIEDDGEVLFRLTEKGKHKLFKYHLAELALKKRGDGKWRLVIYDIPAPMKKASDSFRIFLRKLEFLQIQRSVYLTPYPCNEEIEFLKHLYHIEKYVTILTISKIEGEEAYRRYFGI